MKNDALKMALDRLKMKVGAHQDAKSMKYAAAKKAAATPPPDAEGDGDLSTVDGAGSESELLELLENELKRK